MKASRTALVAGVFQLQRAPTTPSSKVPRRRIALLAWMGLLGVLRVTKGHRDGSEISSNHRSRRSIGRRRRRLDPTPAVVGGTPASGMEQSYFVRGERGCGAALVAPDVVLGAAHCAGFYGNRVLVGALDKNSAANGSAVYRRVLSGMMAHPRFQLTPRGALSYDFVLFRIDSVQGYGGIRCIELNEDPVATQPGRQVKIVGFGALVWNGTESERLMTASVSTIDTEECERRYGRKPGFLDESVTCTLGSGTTTCYGDSGGPVVDSSGRLIGITSFGTTYCDPTYPSGSASVAAAMPWIKETACGLTNFRLPYCSPRPTASPTTTPTVAKIPATLSQCISIQECADRIKRQCGCPKDPASRGACSKRIMRKSCCSSPDAVKERYSKKSARLYRRGRCGFKS